MISIIFGLIASLIYASIATTVSMPITIAVGMFVASWAQLFIYTAVLFTTLKVIAKNPKLEADLKLAMTKELL